MKIITTILLCSIVLLATSVSLAFEDRAYEIELLIQDGKKTKELDSTLTIKEDSFVAGHNQSKYKNAEKTFNYDDVKVADYSYSKKPLFSTGGSVAVVLLLGLAAIPLLFVKKKRHWITLRTENDFVVMKLQKTNYKQIMAEFETKGIKINTINEEDQEDEKKKDKKKDDDESDQSKDDSKDDDN